MTEHQIFQRSKARIYYLSPAKEWKAEDKCLNCGKQKKDWLKGRRHYWSCCSIICTEQSIRYVFTWDTLRERCFRRDNFCVICGIKGVKSLIADHILAIALGGIEEDINNLQTLCGSCNKIKTKADMAKIAEKRKIVKNGANLFDYP